MKIRITTTMIAQEAGVHQTTVSLALRGDRRLRPETIARVRAVAARLGYVPDPLLTALAAYRRARRPAPLQGVLAWVTNWATRAGWRCRPMFEQFWAGARRRAGELGYRLEEFWLRAEGLSARRAAEILRARGVQGLVLAPQADGVTTLDFAWEAFSVVTIGPTLRTPALHMVSNDQYRTMGRLCELLAARGYRRIGYAIQRHTDARLDGQWSAGFERWQRDRPAARRTRRYEGEPVAERFRAWLARERPDVVIGCSERMAGLAAAGRRPGGPAVDFALLGVGALPGRYAGMDENAEQVGATAVERLAALVQLGERGVPAAVTRTLLDARWVEGATVRRREDAIARPGRAR